MLIYIFHEHLYICVGVIIFSLITCYSSPRNESSIIVMNNFSNAIYASHVVNIFARSNYPCGALNNAVILLFVYYRGGRHDTIRRLPCVINESRLSRVMTNKLITAPIKVKEIGSHYRRPLVGRR